MRVALVHDWLDGYRGGEKVLEALCEMFPEAPIYTLFLDRGRLPETLAKRDIRYPRKLNYFKKMRRLLLPILPHFIENLTLRDYDLAISSSSCVAKGVIPGPNTKHICYIHSPMRYIWDQQHHYLDEVKKIPGAGLVFRFMNHRLRIWDQTSSVRVDQFIANSHFVAQRVKRFYGRESQVVHPPIDLDRLLPYNYKPKTADEYYLCAGAFVAYKRFDLAIEACRRKGRTLVVAGSGGQESELRRIAGGETRFVIAPQQESWIELIRNAKALLFPALEDFGMIAIEAMALGIPVIAYDQGGSRDFIRQGETGLFFSAQTPESLGDAISRFESQTFDKQKIIDFAKIFTTAQFHKSMMAVIDSVMV